MNLLKNTNIVSYSFMIIGVLTLLINEAIGKNQFILIIGLSFLVIGIYNLSKKLSSKGDDYKEPLVRSEKLKDKNEK